MLKASFLVASALILASGSIASAESSATQLSASAPKKSLNTSDPRGFVPFIGLSAGHSSYSVTTSQESIPTNLKALGNYYFEAPIVLEAGAGLQNNALTQGTRSDDNVVTTVIETAARYRFGQGWQGGLVYNALVSNGEKFASQNPDFTHFVGAQATKEWGLSKNIFRAGARIMKGVSIADQSAYVGMLDLALSFGGG